MKTKSFQELIFFLLALSLAQSAMGQSEDSPSMQPRSSSGLFAELGYADLEMGSSDLMGSATLSAASGDSMMNAYDLKIGCANLPAHGLGGSLAIGYIHNIGPSNLGISQIAFVIPEANLSYSFAPVLYLYSGLNYAIYTGDLTTGTSYSPAIGGQLGMGLRVASALYLKIGGIWIGQNLQAPMDIGYNTYLGAVAGVQYLF